MAVAMKNFVYNIGYQMLCIVIPLISMPYLARTLGVVAIGINSYTNSVVSLFATFGLLGLANYSNREIAYSSAKSEEELSRTFISLCIIRCLLLVICLVIYLVTVAFSEYSFYFYMQMSMLLYYFLDVSWLFVGVEDMKIVVIRNSMVKLISMAIIFLFVKKSSDLGIYILINGGGMLLGACTMFQQVPRYIHFVHIAREDVTRHIVPIIRLFLPQAATTIYVLFDKTMIKWLTGDVAGVGIYEQSQSISKVPLVLAGALSTVMLPRISNEYFKGNMKKVKSYLEAVMDIAVTMAYPFFLGLAGIAPVFVRWYLGEKFLECIPLLQILSLVIVPIFFTNVTGVMYLMALDKTKELTISYMVAAGINLILNLVLIPAFGAFGAAVGIICAEFTVLFIQYYYMKKEIGSMHILKKSVKSILVSAAMFFIIWMLGKNMEYGIKAVLVQVFAGGSFYCICMCLLKKAVIVKKGRG